MLQFCLPYHQAAHHVLLKNRSLQWTFVLSLVQVTQLPGLPLTLIILIDNVIAWAQLNMNKYLKLNRLKIAWIAKYSHIRIYMYM